MWGGGESSKGRQNEWGCMNSEQDRGKLVKKSEIFADIIYGSPPAWNKSSLMAMGPKIAWSDGRSLQQLSEMKTKISRSNESDHNVT